jgi:hypothetical protein
MLTKGFFGGMHMGGKLGQFNGASTGCRRFIVSHCFHITFKQKMLKPC